ncbi:histidine kinase [Azoarcus sp. DN11]|uniref:sensor histidine kinase n=1 Tax=Azoarcus sp. DN11 TaxID=356837 RepID=UPI000EB19770|nr:histidine kinase [Azoarcus sp. DN11]AYH46118.1 hypothetical protein CDA09_22530 [Azoarcus sp. DN11]
MNAMSSGHDARETAHASRGDEAQTTVLRAIAQVRAGAVREERARIARELHDDVLQLLAGVAMQLKALRGEEQREGRAGERLEALHALIVNEQHRLRRLVESLERPAAPGSCEGGDLDARLASLAGRLAREWMIEVSVRSMLARALPEKLEPDLLHIVSEGVANAARHGGASHLRVDVRADDGVLRIIIADDGTGFPFRGYYDGCDLCREALGPRSLSARVGALGGRLGIHSTGEGARVEIRIPLAPRRPVADAEDHPRI